MKAETTVHCEMGCCSVATIEVNGGDFAEDSQWRWYLGEEELENTMREMDWEFAENDTRKGWVCPNHQIAYTDASFNYDGFGTMRLEVVGTTKKGKLVRRVVMQSNGVKWQMERYLSGMNLAVLAQGWDPEIYLKGE